LPEERGGFVMNTQQKLAIVGGSGIYDTEMFEDVEEVRLHTPFGSPSGPIQVGRFKDMGVVFLPRHGKGHTHPPHKVNYRANVWALKELGVERIISVCAVGSLKEELMPGDVVIPDQFIDFTKKRDYTFYDGGRTVHISTADPFCPQLRSVFTGETEKLGIRHHGNGTYITIEGPRFSTRAESRMFRSFADIIGMTLNPEVQLAREKEMCYVCLAMVTDYDVWAEKPVSLEDVLRTVAENEQNIKKILRNTLSNIDEKRGCACGEVLKDAVI
jgi:5'-methylthioadenosine phosphorylase